MKINNKNKLFLGVCANLSKLTKIQPMYFRLIFLFLFLLFGLGPILYFILWLLMKYKTKKTKRKK